MSPRHQDPVRGIGPIRVPIGLWLGATAIASLGFAWLEHASGALSPIMEKFRGNMFSGFVSMGSVLMAMKTFIVVRLQEKLYSQPSYERRHRKANGGSIEGIYEPLRNLSDFLIVSVAACLTAAVIQIIVGDKVNDLISTGLTSGFAFGAIFMVMSSWWLLRNNIKDYFDHLDNEHQQPPKGG